MTMTRIPAMDWFRRLALTLALSIAAAIYPAAPMVAIAQAPPDDAQPLLLGNDGSSDLGEATLVPDLAEEALLTDQSTQPVGPGMSLTSFTRFDARGWVRGYALRVDLSHPAVTADLLTAPSVAAAEPLSAMAERAGAVAGVNGDFFDINNTKAPLGVGIQAGELIHSAVPGWTKAAGVGADRLGYLAEVLLDGTVNLPGGPVPLAGVNQLGIPAGGIGLYTPRWGAASLRSTAGASPQIRMVTVVDDQVVSVADAIGDEPIPAEGYVLIGRDAGAVALAALTPGDSVTVAYSPRQNTPSPLQFAVGGSTYLIRGGEIVNLDDRDAHPRTAVGFTADGRRMILATVDGRQKESRGMTLLELARLMSDLGAHEALSLDGGGSSTMLARQPGADQPGVINSPSDGFERLVPNGIGLFVTPGSGNLQGLRVEPATAQADTTSVAGPAAQAAAPTAAGPTSQADLITQANHPLRVFPGLSRRFTAIGYDEHFGPAPTPDPQWRLLPSDVGAIDADGRLVGRKSGTATVEAKAQSVVGSLPVRVLGELDRLAVEPGRLGLAPGTTGRFTVVGYDAIGYAAPIDPADVTLSFEPGLVSITPEPDGSFTVTPHGEGGVLVTLTVRDLQVYLPITVGMNSLAAAGFEQGEGWTVTKFPAQVGAAMGFDQGRNGDALRLQYDFSTTTATRAAYIQAQPLLELPGEPRAVGLWVHGDGQSAWLRAVLRDAANTAYTINLASRIDWTGWRYVEAAVPPGVQYPLRLWRVYPVETNRARQYTGKLLFDDLTVKVAVSLTAPAEPTRRDPLIAQAPLDPQRWRFALLADLHVAAANPNSKDVRHAREAIRQALAAEPDFLVIGGDFVDTAYPEDFALARQILDEEVGDRLPVYYIPGNHEIMGTGTLESFRAAFGSNRFSFDHKGSRIILLDSSTTSFRTADYPQLLELASALQEAASDPAVQNVVIIGHHPTRDPMPTQSSQLGDQLEARLLEQMLTRFREESDGKGALYLSGHAHVVDVKRVEGLPYMVMGPVGKTPYGPADQGGFYAWTLFGIDPTPIPDRAAGPEEANEQSAAYRAEWIRAEVRPLLEGITLEAPTQVRVGEAQRVTATGHQTGGRTFPLRYPATVIWSGSEGLLVASGADAERALQGGQYLAHFDPETGLLRALKAGSITLRVESNGMQQEVVVELTP